MGIQRLIEHCSSVQLKKILSDILNGVEQLVCNKFSNYVVQHLLELGVLDHKKRIIHIVKDNVLEYAKHKCGSNVVEKCLEEITIGAHSDSLEKERTEFLKAILDGNPPPIHGMLCDRYGFYTVYRMIEYCSADEKAT